MISTPQEFWDFIVLKAKQFDYQSVKPWEFETLKHYFHASHMTYEEWKKSIEDKKGWAVHIGEVH